jgi:phosphinothricin acetyltransferase
VIEPLQPSDWPHVRAIYEAAMAQGDATFETAAPTWPEWDAAHLQDHRFVERSDGEVVGWVAATPVSSRCVYRGVAEISVYVSPAHTGRGIGRRLLEALIESTERAGIWTLEAGIFPENQVSLRLHERCGFRVVGVRERLGQMNGVWRDVVLLERRSNLVGGDPRRA